MERHRGDRAGSGDGGGRRMPSRWSSGSPTNQPHRYPRGGGEGFAGGRNHPYHAPNDFPPAGGGGPGFRGGGGPGGFGHQMPMPGQKRGFSGRGNSPDYADGNKFAKLFIGSVPKTATEEEIRPLFEEHGNVIEVALIKDRRTGEQQGCCFIKYATSEEADGAIRALHNQYTLPGGSGPIQVRYADGERERAGTVEDKLFVASLNKRATEQEIAEIFSPYGHVEDVYLMRDELKQSRGCGFVKFSNREMAAAAMNALHGIFVMRGCDQPLIVRFADPKRPRPGESRGGPAFGGPGFGPRPDGFGSRSDGFGPRSEGFGPRSEASVVIRPTSNLDEPMGGRMPPNAWGPISLQSLGPSSQASTHGFGSHSSAKGGVMETSSAATSTLGDTGGPTNGSLSSIAATPSSSAQQVHSVVGQQIPSLQKPLMTPQHFPPHHNQQFSASSSQTQTLQAPMQQLGQLQNPQSIGLPSSQTLPSQQLPGLSGQLSASQPLMQQNASATALQTPLGLQQQGMSAAANQQQLLQRPAQQLSSQLPQVLLQQQAQALQSSFQSSQQAIFQLQQQLQLMQQSGLSQQQSSQTAKQQSPWSGPQTTSSTPASTPAIVMPSTVSATPSQPVTTTSSVPLTCNWTEHTSPEGFKYYYNSATRESKWEKPEEFSIFEQQQQQQKLLLLQQQQQKLAVPQLQSPANIQSHTQIQPTQQISQTQQLQPQMQLRQQAQLQLLQPSLAYHASGVATHQNNQDFNYAQLQAVSSVSDPARVQQGIQAAHEWTWQNKPAGS